MRCCKQCGTDLDKLCKNKKALFCTRLCKQRFYFKQNPQKYRDANKLSYNKNKETRLKKVTERYNKLTDDEYNAYLLKGRLSYHKNKSNGKVLAKCAKRRAAELQRCPKWLSEFDLFYIEELYALAKLRSKLLGIVYEVDHIVPLQGNLVSGLHVPQNLQLLSRTENRRKKNIWEQA